MRTSTSSITNAFIAATCIITASIVTGGVAGRTVAAHPPNQPSIHDTMAGVIDRMKSTLPLAALKGISSEQAVRFLTTRERRVLGTSYWMFDVNVPVTVSVIRDSGQAETLFWLTDGGWKKSEETVQADGLAYEVWQKKYGAGHVGLGTNGFRRHWRHYCVAVQAQDPQDKLSIRNMYPGVHRTVPMTKGSSVFVYDPLYALEKVPASLEGATLIQAVENRVYETLLVDLFRTTPFPATPLPDQIVLTWSEDPATTQTIQWRTDTSVTAPMVRYRKANHSDVVASVPATTLPLIDRGLVNDSKCHRHTVILSNLAPSTTYEYSIATSDGGTQWTGFTTAPDRARAI